MVRLLTVLVLLAALAAPCSGASSDEATVTVLATNDLHGTLLDVDYFKQQPASDIGLVKLVRLVRALRRHDPSLLLLDAGDTFQGSPLVHQANVEPVPGRLHPMVAAMNEAGYDAMVPGNHDFDYGRPFLDRVAGEARFPLLAANAVDAKTGEPRFTPFVVKDVQGVRVGILGITSPGIPEWLPKRLWAGLRFEDSIPCARRWVPVLRDRERCSLVVVVFHGGPDNPRGDSRPTDNNGYELARTVPGIDLLLMAHTHRFVDGERVGGALLLMAGSYARALGEARFTLRRAEDGRWRVTRSTARVLMNGPKLPRDAAVARLTAEDERRTQAWLATPLARVEGSMDLNLAAYRDSELLDLIQDLQREATGAPVSVCSVLDPYARLEGAVTVRDVFRLYAFENTLFRMRMRGADVRAYLENVARAYRMAPDGRSVGLDPAFPAFNIDQLAGLDYELDPRRPLGARVVFLRDSSGRDLADDAVVDVAMNSYRTGGSGGYEMVRRAEVVREIARPVRDLVADGLRARGVVRPARDDNWRLSVGPPDVTFVPVVKP